MTYNVHILIFIVLSGFLFYAFVPLIRGIRTRQKFQKTWRIVCLLCLIPIALFDLVLGFLFLVTPGYTHRSFNREDWATQIHQRHTMVDDLVESKNLIGLTKKQVVHLLGKPYNPYPQLGITEERVLYYDMSDKPASGADPWVLIIEFQEDRVSKYYLTEL